MTSLFLIIAVVVLMVAANLATNRMPERWYVVMAALFAIGLFSIGIGFGLRPADLGLARVTWLTGVQWAAVAIGAVAVVYLVGALFRPTRILYADQRATELRGRDVARRALFDIPFGTVLLEEMAFRGVLYGMLAVEFSDATAVVGTSVLFGLWHLLPAIPMHAHHHGVARTVGTGWIGRVITVLATVIGTAGAGVGFALLRWWTGSILPGIGLHWALNGLGVLTAWMIARLTGRSALRHTLESQVNEQIDAEIAYEARHEMDHESAQHED